MNHDELTTALATMDIPEMRRDCAQPQNVAWLLRNLAINNADHDDLDKVITALKRLRPHA